MGNFRLSLSFVCHTLSFSQSLNSVLFLISWHLSSHIPLILKSQYHIHQELHPFFFHSVPPESFPSRVRLYQYLTYFSPAITNRFYRLKIAAGRSCVSVIRCHLCAPENALKDINTEHWTTASGDSRNQQPIISRNELKNVSCKRQIRHKTL